MTFKIKSTDPRSQGAFVIINRTDFNPQMHELYGADNDRAALAERVPTKDELLAAHEELERRAAADARNVADQLAQIQKMRADLDAQAAAQEAEALRLRVEATKLAETAPAKGKTSKPE
ncbi:hypothetical protein [Massilia sp. CCM 8734]|uniref:hypothetical protein n=1 Tax=Massilia sp. CCM 8734 TaxID=2609283 RepID=UPI00141ED583|nr:hypothetical protein [Massilia sp. CCM 8734]NHZ94558.1 hypothetical protein [Massilia sp. CCM 8734]